MTKAVWLVLVILLFIAAGDAVRFLLRVENGKIAGRAPGRSWWPEFTRGLELDCPGESPDRYDPCRLGRHAALLTSGSPPQRKLVRPLERIRSAIATGLVLSRTDRVPDSTASHFQWDGWAFAEATRRGYARTLRRCLDLGRSLQYDACLFGIGRAAYYTPEILHPLKAAPAALIAGYRSAASIDSGAKPHYPF